MNKMFSFMAGALCGVLVGGVTALLLTPNSGEQLRADVRERLETAVSEARKAMAEKEQELTAQFEQMKNG
ncbi:MAG: YtxH domain-containing protein [Anaerolineae bacterium]